MARLLVVEDDPATADLLRDHLSRAGHEVSLAHTGAQALAQGRATLPELIVLDWMLPELSGPPLCRTLRELLGHRTVIMMLTARGDESDALEGFEAGADDYVRKPFGVRELIQRVEALLRLVNRRTLGQPGAWGPLCIDASARSASVHGTAVRLTPMELDLLIHFAAHPHVVLSRSELLRAVWGYGHDGYARTIDTHVLRLRKKLAQAGLAPDVIATVHRAGYRFEPPESGA